MTIYLAKYVPLVLDGQRAITQFNIPPYVDASCRREPDLECELPSISALCRGELFAPHLKEGDEVVYITGVASALLAALKHDRKAMGIDREINYINEAKSRIGKLFSGELPYRTLGKPVHQPTGKEKVAQVPQEWLEKKESHEISSGLLV